jgi:hypothetical protein
MKPIPEDDLLSWIDSVLEAERKLDRAWKNKRELTERYLAKGVPAPPNDDVVIAFNELTQVRVDLATLVVNHYRNQ